VSSGAACWARAAAAATANSGVALRTNLGRASITPSQRLATAPRSAPWRQWANQHHHHSFRKIVVRNYSFGILSRPSKMTNATAKHAPEAMSPKTSKPCKAWTLGLLKLENSDINPNIKTNAPAIRLRLFI
jgi:hypothetical protein